MGIWDTLTGKSAANTANQAAATTYKNQLNAAQSANEAGSTYNAGVQGVSQNYIPYAQGGTAALDQLMAGLGLGGDQQAFINAYQALPGYQEGLKSGTDAVARGLNTTGMLNSGRAMKALQRFGSDYENQRSGDYLTRLMGLSGMGLGATDAQSKMQQAGYGGQLQGNLAGAGMQYGGAGTLGQGMIAGANAQTQGLQNLMNVGTNLAGKALSFGMA